MPFRADYTREVLENYKTNIDTLCNALEEFPWIECPRPMGSQFTFADITASGMGDVDFAQHLYEQGLITVYGSPWGPDNGPGHIRFTLSNPADYQRRCVDKLVGTLRGFEP
jgi:aspartate/methionine/tyrosine aminotransferase